MGGPGEALLGGTSPNPPPPSTSTLPTTLQVLPTFSKYFPLFSLKLCHSFVDGTVRIRFKKSYLCLYLRNLEPEFRMYLRGEPTHPYYSTYILNDCTLDQIKSIVLVG